MFEIVIGALVFVAVVAGIFYFRKKDAGAPGGNLPRPGIGDTQEK